MRTAAGRRGGGGSSADSQFTLGSADIAQVLKSLATRQVSAARDSHFFSGHLAWPGNPAGLDLTQASGEVELNVETARSARWTPAQDVCWASSTSSPAAARAAELPRCHDKGWASIPSPGISPSAAQCGDARSQCARPFGAHGGTWPHRTRRARFRRARHRLPECLDRMTVGAALLGGPAGAAIALVAQELFGPPDGQAGRSQLPVTGSWDNR